MDTKELPSLIVGSRTQSPETIQKLLSEDYEGITVNTISDAPAEQPGAEEGKTEAGEEDSSASSNQAGGGDAAELDEDETAGVTDAGTAATDAEKLEAAKKRKSGAARSKEKFQRLADEIETLKRQLAETSSSPEIVIPAEIPEPNPDDFENGVYDAGYIKAVARRERTEAQREELIAAKTTRDSKVSAAAEAQAKAEADARKAAWAEQVEIGQSRHNDFDEVLKKSSAMEAAVPLTEAIQDSDFSGLLVYHLATHPDELKRLNQMLELPKGATNLEFRKKLRLAHREIDRLETIVSQAGDAHTDTDDAANGSGADQTTETAREGRPAATSAPLPATAAAPAAPKAKPEPVRPVGGRGGVPRPKRVQDMSREEIHRMQTQDPDGFRRLMEASRAS